MFNIGFYDYYFDEWHANNYPSIIREEIKRRGLNMELKYAFADKDSPSLISSEEWCEKNNFTLCKSIKEFTEVCDGIMILAPNFPEEHERMAQIPLLSGKPVYMDKTFSPNKETGERIRDLAEKNNTPLFSSSALRFADELTPYRNNENNALWCATTGPYSFETYAIHQIEIIQTVMGGRPQSVKAFSNKAGRNIVFDYGDDRMASILQLEETPFQIAVSDGKTCIYQPIKSKFFEKLAIAIVEYFIAKIPPVAAEDTLSAIAMRDAAQKAIDENDVWFEIL